VNRPAGARVWAAPCAAAGRPEPPRPASTQHVSDHNQKRHDHLRHPAAHMTDGWAGAERFCPNRDGAERGVGVSRCCGSRFCGLVQQVSAGGVPLPGSSRMRHRADCARVLPAAQCRAVGGDQAGPDTVLADIPLPQRQFQALGAYQAGGADGDRRGRLVAGLVCFRTDREPLVGIEGAVSAAGT